MMNSNLPLLESSEAEKIYYALFREAIPNILKYRFVEASRMIIKRFSQREQSLYIDALERISDLEALELAARRKGQLPLLCMKFTMMVFLAETLPENQKIFINHEKDKPLLGTAAIATGLMRTGYKFVKGLLLLRALKNV